MNTSKKQPIRFTLLLTSAIACLVAAPSARSSEPSYNGRPLSEWLLILKERHAFEMIDEADAQAAIRQIGTNGIPTMIDLLNVYDERSAKKVLSKLHNKDLTACINKKRILSAPLKMLENWRWKVAPFWEPTRNLPFHRSPMYHSSRTNGPALYSWSGQRVFPR